MIGLVLMSVLAGMPLGAIALAIGLGIHQRLARRREERARAEKLAGTVLTRI